MVAQCATYTSHTHSRSHSPHLFHKPKFASATGGATGIPIDTPLSIHHTYTYVAMLAPRVFPFPHNSDTEN